MSSQSTPSSVAVIGGGSWGTALGWLLGTKGLSVRLWVKEPEVVDVITRTRVNEVYLPGFLLPGSLHPTTSLAEAMAEVEVLIVVVPCRWLRSMCQEMVPCLREGTTVVSAAKGLEVGAGRRPTEVMRDVWGDERNVSLVALSGPNLARELVAGIPAATVVASADQTAAERAQALLTAPTFRVYTNRDVAGVELGGALKNIIAIGAGLNDGLGFGDNTKATLVTRGLAEMVRLGMALGAQRETFYGLSGVGDLYTTCASTKSRNHTVGFRLGQGETLGDITESTPMVAEGIDTTREALRQARLHDVEVPITEQLHAILFEGHSPRQSVSELMSRGVKAEAE